MGVRDTTDGESIGTGTQRDRRGSKIHEPKYDNLKSGETKEHPGVVVQE